MAQIPNMNWMGDQPTGSAYDVYQYYLGGGSPGGTTPTSGGGGGGITSLPWYQQTGGGNDGYKGGGQWGNLDLSNTKTFNKDVWGGEIGGPANMYGGWKPQDVTGYLNPQTGQYQTFEGKNINHLGIEVPSLIGALFDKDLGKGPQIGDIKGTFTEGWDKGLENIKEGTDEWFEAVKSKIGWSKKKAKKALKDKNLQKEIDAHNKKAADDAKQAQLEASYTGPKTKSWDPVQHEKSGGGHYSGSKHSKTSGPQSGSYGVWGAEGGMITKDLTKDPEYRGWKKMYEANPGVGSMHEKHPTFIKFYKQHERDKKKFGGLAGLLYG